MTQRKNGLEILQYMDSICPWKGDRAKSATWNNSHLNANDIFELREVPLDKIWTQCKPHSKRNVKKYAKLKTPSPAVVLTYVYSIFDGNHRIDAAKLKGEKTIWAWVEVRTV